MIILLSLAEIKDKGNPDLDLSLLNIIILGGMRWKGFMKLSELDSQLCIFIYSLYLAHLFSYSIKLSL